MRIRVLGPLEVFDGREWQHIGAPKWRLLLALLITEAPTPVPTGRLEAELWPGGAPPSAANQIHGYVSRLRRLLGDPSGDLLRTRSPGYQLALGPNDLDVDHFEASTRDGLGALPDDPTQASTRLADALDVWRGPAYADVPENLTIETEASRLEERRLVAVESRLEADLRHGHAAVLIPELRRLTNDHPLRERFWEQLMLAYARSGRLGEALLAYRELHRTLTENLGIEPGSAVRDLHRQLLATEPDQPVDAREADRQPVEHDTKIVAVPRQLPLPVSGFVGRDQPLAELDDAVGPNRIVLIDGTAGVGKTTLAVHWSHQNAADFPDGQLYLDLRGFGPDPPLRPIDALGRLLRSLGIEPHRIPPEPDEASAMLRTLLAGRKPLLLLDNARDITQVEPLLCPGSVIITSRSRLSGLVARHGARRVELRTLNTEQSAELLHQALDDRVTAEPDAAAELAELCGGLPLALRITAALLADEPDRSLAAQVSTFANEDRLRLLRLDGDDRANIQAVLEHSYRWLLPEPRRMLRLLGLVPGADIDTWAAAALADRSVRETERLLDALVAAHLVERRTGMPVDADGRTTAAGRTETRYAPHDLVKLYAAELAVGQERESAAARLLAWYLHTADQAMRLTAPSTVRLIDRIPEQRPRRILRDRRAALRWLDAERSNLRAAARLAAERGQPAAWILADLLRAHYLVHRHTAEWLALARVGHDAAHSAGDERGQAAALLSLGQAERCIGRYDDALTHLTTAAQTSDRVGWRAGETQALNEIAVAYLEQGDLTCGAEVLERAIALARTLSNRLDLTRYLMNLGLLHWQLGRLTEATEQLEEAVGLASGEDAQLSRALAGSALGMIYRLQGRTGESSTWLLEAVTALTDVGHHAGLAGAAGQLALTCCDLGRSADALGYADAAVDAAERAGNPRLEAASLVVRCNVKWRTGDLVGAVTDGERGVRRAAETGSKIELAEGRIVLGLAYQETGQLDAASDKLLAGYALARDNGFRVMWARAAHALAGLYGRLGDHPRARELRTEHARLAASTGYAPQRGIQPQTEPGTRAPTEPSSCGGSRQSCHEPPH